MREKALRHGRGSTPLSFSLGGGEDYLVAASGVVVSDCLLVDCCLRVWLFLGRSDAARVSE